MEFTKAEYVLEPWSPFNTLRIDTTKHVAGFSDLNKAIHLHGARTALQISPALGSWVIPPETYCPGFQPVGPTEFACPGAAARALTTGEVEGLAAAYGAAALRARMAGFDAVEIHGHSSYLLGQFMSPYVNTRTDKYGALHRLPVELLQSVKAMAGPDFPVIFRISGSEFLDGGRDVKGSIEICRRMEKEGVAAIDVSGGAYYTPESNRVFPYMTLPRGAYMSEAEEIKRAVKVPVILPGKLSDPADAERALQEGKADFIAVGRGLIADPELPNKTAEGRLEDIRPCKRDIKPLVAWMASRVMKADVHVSLGKEVGAELVAELEPDVVVVALGADPIIPKIPGMHKSMTAGAIDVLSGKAEVGKKVVVAGGGLVGCDVAAFLADQGKEVTIVERSPEMALQVELYAGSRGALLLMLDKKGVASLTNMKLEEITDQGAVVSDKEGVKRVIEADSVVLALGFTPRKTLYEALKGMAPEVYAIGDSIEPRGIGNAIHEGFFRGSTI